MDYWSFSAPPLAPQNRHNVTVLMWIISKYWAQSEWYCTKHVVTIMTTPFPNLVLHQCFYCTSAQSKWNKDELWFDLICLPESSGDRIFVRYLWSFNQNQKRIRDGVNTRRCNVAVFKLFWRLDDSSPYYAYHKRCYCQENVTTSCFYIFNKQVVRTVSMLRNSAGV